MKDSHRMRSRLTLVIAMTTVFVAGLLTSQYLYQKDDAGAGKGPLTGVATVLKPPRELAEFELIDQAGQVFDKRALAGRWTLVFMGFTNCGHVCPTTLYTLAEAVKKLPAPPAVLFVSVDPDRDTPEIIDTYVRGFSDSFAGATGSHEQLRVFAESLSAPYFVSQDDGRYIVDHSSAVFLLDPATRLHAVFGAPHDAATIAADLERTINAQSAAATVPPRRY